MGEEIRVRAPRASFIQSRFQRVTRRAVRSDGFGGGGGEKRLEGNEARDATRGPVGPARVSFRARRLNTPALVCIQTHPTPAYLNRVRATERLKPRGSPRHQANPLSVGSCPSGTARKLAGDGSSSSREARDAIRSIEKPRVGSSPACTRVGGRTKTRGALFAARSCRDFLAFHIRPKSPGPRARKIQSARVSGARVARARRSPSRLAANGVRGHGGARRGARRTGPRAGARARRAAASAPARGSARRIIVVVVVGGVVRGPPPARAPIRPVATPRPTMPRPRRPRRGPLGGPRGPRAGRRGGGGPRRGANANANANAADDTDDALPPRPPRSTPPTRPPAELPGGLLRGGGDSVALEGIPRRAGGGGGRGTGARRHSGLPSPRASSSSSSSSSSKSGGCFAAAAAAGEPPQPPPPPVVDLTPSDGGEPWPSTLATARSRTDAGPSARPSRS